MSEKQAKKQLAKMLDSFTPGSVLYLLSDMYRDRAEAASKSGDVVRSDQCKLVEHTLVAVGAGIDAVQPR